MVPPSSICDGTPYLSVEQLSLSLDRKVVLKDISFELNRGCILGIVGPNGAGKSSLLRAIYCYRYEQKARLSGQIRIEENVVRSMSRRDRASKIAVVLQESNLTFAVSVFDVLATGLTPRKSLLSFMTASDQASIQKVATDLDLLPFMERDFSSLSGGEKQRVLIARALVQQPEVLLLDEPTNHLDIQHQIEVLSLVRSLGITVLLTIHDLNMAAAYCDKLAVLSEGALIKTGTPKEVLTPELIQSVFQVAATVEPVAESGHQIRIEYAMPQQPPSHKADAMR